jgi:hypothetical protein
MNQMELIRYATDMAWGHENGYQTTVWIENMRTYGNIYSVQTLDGKWNGTTVQNYWTSTWQQELIPVQYASALANYNKTITGDVTREAVKAEYTEVFLPYVEKKAEECMKNLQKSIEASAKMDKIRWPKAKGYYEEWASSGAYIVNFLEERIEYLNDIWLQDEEYHMVVFLDYDENIYHKYVVKHGEYLPEIPSAANYVAIFRGWQNTETGRKLDVRLPVLEDATYQSMWIPAEYLILNGLAEADAALEDIDIEALEALLEAAKEMKRAAMEQEAEAEASDE